MRSFRMAMFNFNKAVRRLPRRDLGRCHSRRVSGRDLSRPAGSVDGRAQARVALTLEPPRRLCRGVRKLLSDVKLSFERQVADESSAGQTASVSEEAQLAPREKKIFAILKADESTYIDEIVERLEPELSSSEIFAALFEHELAANVRQLSERISWKAFGPLSLQLLALGKARVSCRILRA